MNALIYRPPRLHERTRGKGLTGYHPERARAVKRSHVHDERLQVSLRPPIPPLQLQPQREKSQESAPAPSSAGLIAITGPSMSGKPALAARVSQALGGSVHIAQTDPLMAEAEDEDPEPLRALLRHVRKELRCGRKVVFSAHLATPEQRRRVLDVARQVGAPRLLVELEGTDPEALERVTDVADTLAQMKELLQELKLLLRAYCSVTEREHAWINTLSVPAEAPTSEQLETVLEGWNRLGTSH